MKNKYDQDYLMNYLELSSIPHGVRNAKVHGTGVAKLLKKFSLDTHVVTAGKFHYLYGAESYPELSVPGATRDLVSKCLGKEAEWLIYNYSLVGEISLFITIKFNNKSWLTNRFNGKRINLSEGDYIDLMWLFFCNAMEQLIFEYEIDRNVPVEKRMSKEEKIVWSTLAKNLGKEGEAFFKQNTLKASGF